MWNHFSHFTFKHVTFWQEHGKNMNKCLLDKVFKAFVICKVCLRSVSLRPKLSSTIRRNVPFQKTTAHMEQTTALHAEAMCLLAFVHICLQSVSGCGKSQLDADLQLHRGHCACCPSCTGAGCPGQGGILCPIKCKAQSTSWSFPNKSDFVNWMTAATSVFDIWDFNQHSEKCSDKHRCFPTDADFWSYVKTFSCTDRHQNASACFGCDNKICFWIILTIQLHLNSTHGNLHLMCNIHLDIAENARHFPTLKDVCRPRNVFSDTSRMSADISGVHSELSFDCTRDVFPFVIHFGPFWAYNLHLKTSKQVCGF